MKKIRLNGNDYYLFFNGNAYLTLQDRFEDTNPITLIGGNDAESFKRTCLIAAILAEQGELFRRWEGHDAAVMLTADELAVTLSPVGMATLKSAIVEAITDGYKRHNADENEEIDLGLAELNKKKH